MQNKIFLRIITVILIICFIWQDVTPACSFTQKNKDTIAADSRLRDIFGEFKRVYADKGGSLEAAVDSLKVHPQLTPEDIVRIIKMACVDNAYEKYGGRTFIEYLLLLLKLACKESRQRYEDYLKGLLLVYPFLAESVVQKKLREELIGDGKNAQQTPILPDGGINSPPLGLIPSIQTSFGKFGYKLWYKLLWGPLIEEFIFRWLPFYCVVLSNPGSLFLLTFLNIVIGLAFIYLHEYKSYRYTAAVITLFNITLPFIFSFSFLVPVIGLVFHSLVNIVLWARGDVMQKILEHVLDLLSGDFAELKKDKILSLLKALDNAGIVRKDNLTDVKDLLTIITNESNENKASYKDLLALINLFSKPHTEGYKVHALESIIREGDLIRSKIQMLKIFIPQLEMGLKSGLHTKLYTECIAVVVQGEKSIDFLSDEFRSALTDVSSGRMDINNPMHVLANYLDIVKRITQSGMRRMLSYDEFYKIILKARQNGRVSDLDEADIPEEHKLNIRGVVYEAFIMRGKILEMNKRAREMGRSFVVIGNLSLGSVALAPITEERNGNIYVAGTDIPVWYTKVGSTESHHNEFIMTDNLFTPEQIRFLAVKRPLVAVVDSSTSVSDPNRTSPHIPDGFKGYRNFFIVLNYALYGSVNPEDFYEDEDFVDAFLKTDLAKQLINKIQGMSIKSNAPNPYKFRFWYERRNGPDPDKDEFLYLRVGKKKDMPAPKADISKIDSPSCLFIQSAIHPDDIDPVAQKEFMRGKHKPAFFDNKDNFKEFYMDYEEGYGVVLSKRYVYLARKIFRDFMKERGEAVAVRTAATVNIRRIDTVVLDLDGTLVKTDAEIDTATAGLINDLTRMSKRAVIITEDIEANLERRLAKLVKNPNLVIFTDGGSFGWSYDRAGDKFCFDDYNRRSLINNGLRDRMLGVVKQGTYQLDNRPERVSKGYRLDLRHVKERNIFVDTVQKQLLKEGIKAKVYKAGRTSVKIVLQHKEHALRFIADEFKLNKTRILVMADSAHSRDIDRGMLTALRESVSVNVGGFSPTISRENPNIVQYDNGGIGTTISFLRQISDTGSLPEGWIVPSSKGTPSTEGEEEEKGPAAYNILPVQIGKRAKVEHIIYNTDGKSVAFRVADREIPLTAKEINLRAKIEELGREYSGLLEGIINCLREDAPSVYEYSETEKDLFGFADRKGNFIALHKHFANSPIALFHELGHYLIDTGRMELGITDNELLIGVNGQKFVVILGVEPLAIANKNINNPHYLLRALQRQLFGEKDRNLTVVVKGVQLLRDLEGEKIFKGISAERRRELIKEITRILEKAENGARINEDELNIAGLLDISRITIKEKFELVAKIANFVNSIYPKNIDKAVIVASIEEKILEAVMEEEGHKETDLITKMKKTGETKGISPSELDGIFGLFRNGIDILTMDPALDPGQIDGSYFGLCDQIGRLLGIGQGAVLRIISKQKLNGRKFKVSDGKIIEGTKLYRSARRLEAYNKMYADTKNILKSVPEGVKEKARDAVVVFGLKHFENMPLVGLKIVLGNIEGTNVKLGLRIPEGMNREKISKFITKDWELNGNVILLPENTGKANEELLSMKYENISFVAERGEEIPGGIKAFGIEDGSSFYAVFLFGLMYACTDKPIELIGFLKELRIKNPDKIIQMMINKEFFEIKLIRTKEILEEFKNRRIYLDIAA